MNRKITFPQLADAMAKLTSGNPATAETFMKHLFDLIADSLAKGKSVTIKGIGSFSPGDSQDCPVIWTPEKELADAVNEPFAFFDAVPLGEGVTEDTLEEADTVIDATTEIEQSAATIPVIPPIPPVPSIPPIPSSTKTETAPVEEPVAEDTPQPTGSSKPATAASDDDEIKDTEPMPEAEKAEEQPEEQESTATAEYDYEEKQPGDSPRRFNPWLAAAIGLVAGLIAGFFIGRQHIVTEPTADNGEKTESTAPDTIAGTLAEPIETDSTTLVETEATDTVKTYEPIAVDTISTSRYLTTMSRKYYGDYKFWVYIYEENSDVITNPNRIRPGTTVTIPDPRKYEIDANDPESLRRAEKKIGEISARLAK